MKTSTRNKIHWLTHPSKWRFYPSTQQVIAAGIWVLIALEVSTYV